MIKCISISGMNHLAILDLSNQLRGSQWRTLITRNICEWRFHDLQLGWPLDDLQLMSCEGSLIMFGSFTQRKMWEETRHNCAKFLHHARPERTNARLNVNIPGIIANTSIVSIWWGIQNMEFVLMFAVMCRACTQGQLSGAISDLKIMKLKFRLYQKHIIHFHPQLWKD